MACWRLQSVTAASALAFGAAFFLVAPAQAVQVSSKVYYFPVRGTSASSIFTSVVVHGPGGQSGVAMATTTATFSQKFKLHQGKRCRLRHYRLKVDIVMKLPRLATIRRVSPSLRRTWRNFARYVRRHENWHKRTYISCARRAELKARRIANRASCNGVASALSRNLATEVSRCEKLHNAYDRREASRVRRLGLIVRATRLKRARPVKKKRKRYRRKRR